MPVASAARLRALAALRMFVPVAVANVAVQMGPRNTRRLINGEIALGVVAALVAAFVLLTRSPNPSGSGLSAGSSQGIGSRASATPMLDKLTSVPLGTTKQQVRRRLGAPTKIVGKCWQYAVNEETYEIHGGRRYNAGMWNAERLCFGWPGGILASTESEINGTWYGPGAPVGGRGS